MGPESVDRLREETVSMLEELVAADEGRRFPESSSSPALPSSFYAAVLHDLAAAQEDEEAELQTSWTNSELVELERCSREAAGVVGQLATSKLALAHLRVQYEDVAGSTSNLHDACEQLMSDQTRLAGVAEEIRTRLAYFARLSQISQKLSSGGLSVTGESFAALLNSIDEAILFLQTEVRRRFPLPTLKEMVSKTEYKESAAYLAKYQQCLSRALSLVKQAIVASFHHARDNIHAKLKADPSMSEDSFTLYYGMFAGQAQVVLNLMAMLETKWDRNIEYENVVSECYEAYFSTRDSLLGPSVRATVQEMIRKHGKSCCTLTRTGCSFLLRLCEDEYRLFYHDFLERMCNIFYESLRPLVIHIPHLENLTELCSIIKNEFLEDRCAPDPEQYSGFMSMGNALLGDVGEKLVFRAHTYAATDILGYTPAPGDLAYPEKLLMMQEIARTQSDEPPTDAKNPTEAGKGKGTSAADLHGLWYPTVRRTVLTLSKLYRCLDLEVFQGLSQDILEMCVQSLKVAVAKILTTKKPLDAQLFLVKHLLILREQTAPFRGNMSHRETSLDFSKFKDSAFALLTTRNRLFTLNSNNALLELITQVPAHVQEQRVDGRRALDGQLREGCQTLISIASANVVHELNDWLSKAEVVRSMGKGAEGGSPTKLSVQPFATPANFHSVLSQAYRKLKDYVPILRASLSLYIGNRDTENILFAPIRKNLETAFEKVLEIVANEYTPEEAQVINAPSIQQISLMLSQAPVSKAGKKTEPSPPPPTPIQAPKTEEAPLPMPQESQGPTDSSLPSTNPIQVPEAEAAAPLPQEPPGTLSEPVVPEEPKDQHQPPPPVFYTEEEI